MNIRVQISTISIFKKSILTILFLSTCLLVHAQVTFTSSQTISTNQTYLGPVSIGTGTITIASGTTTINGSLSIGSGGALVIQNGAKVIVNGVIFIGNSSNGNLVVQNGGFLTVNPGASGGTAAININSSATTALDIQTGGSVIVNAGTGGILGMYETSASVAKVAGTLQIRGGGFKMDGTAKLSYTGSGNDTIIGPSNAGAYFSNGTTLSVAAGVNLYISGDVKNDVTGTFVIDGNVKINGNYQSGNTTANIIGTGTVSTSGSLDADGNQGSVFGQRYSCPAGPCAGNNLISSANTNTCNGGVVNITGVAIAGATYQWFVSTTSASTGFSNAPGASTGQDYATTGSSTTQYTYYKRQYTLSGTTYNSNTLRITSSYWTAAPAIAAITGTNSLCVGATTTLSNATSGGVWSSALTSIATINASGLVSFVSPGSSVISYTVTSGGCSSASTFTINVIGVPIVTTVSSAGTYTIPAGAKAALIQVWGAGGGASKGYSNLKGTGGGGGGFSQKNLAATPGDVISYTIGAGGTGATVSGNGQDGGTTTATLNANVVGASGGSGGQSATTPSGTGGNGGTGLYDFNLTGGSGAMLSAPGSPSPGGGGGGSAGTLLNGNNSGNSTPGGGSSGGTAVAGGGAGGDGNGNGSGNGANGSFPGGGGGGNAGSGNGGNGANGQVTITVYYTRISYSSIKYCNTVTSAIPTITGVTGGTFSSTSGLTINSTTGEINPSTSTAGNYTVNYSTSACGVISSTLVGIQALPVAAAGGTQTICQSTAATVSGATSSNGTIAWTHNGSGSITGASTLVPVYTSVAGDAGNTVLLTMTVTNSPCTNATATYSVLVKGTPTATAGGSQTICQSSTATVSGASSSFGTISWTDNGGGSITSGASTLTPVYTPSAGDVGNTVTLTMKVVNSPCTNATATYFVSVVGTPKATAGGSQTICQSTTATVSGATSSNGTIAWTHNGSGSMTGTSTLTPVYTSVAGDAGNTVLLTMTVSNSSCPNATANYSVVVSTCARTWTGNSSTNWNNTANWSPTIVPIATDAVVIPSAATRMPTISTNANAKSVTNSGTINFTAAGALNVYGNITNTGTVTPVVGSKVSFVGNTAQSISGVPVLYNVIINNAAGVSISSALTLRGALTLTSGVLTTNSNLTIDFELGGNIGYNSGDLGTVSGNVSGRRGNVGVRTHYIAAPFSGVTVAQVQATTPLYVSPYWKMYTKDFTNQNWAAVTSISTAMPLGTGFSLSLPAAAPLIFTGTYDHAFTFTSPSYSNAAIDKYILVGNPYPSAIDWSAASGWTKENVADAIYYWDPAYNRSAAYVAGVGTNNATKYIPAMTSFMITTTGTGGNSSVSMNNNVRLSLQNQNPSYWRVAEDDVIRLTLISSDTTKRDEAVIRFNEMATDTFDFDLDAHKILNTGIIPSIYTNSGKAMYAINSFASVDSAEYIPVGAKLPVDGTYKLKITGNNPNIDYILIDKQLGTQRSIDADSSYTFSGLRTDDVNRFELQLRVAAVTVPTGIQSANMNGGLGIYSSTKGFVIKTDRYAGEQAEIEILDVTGNSIEVLSGKNLSSGSTYIPVDLTDGTYLVKVNVEGNTFAGVIVLVK